MVVILTLLQATMETKETAMCPGIPLNGKSMIQKPTTNTSEPAPSILPSLPSRRGFALMDPVKQRAIASQGGKALKPDQRSFSQNRNLAKEAGRKGGRA